MPGKILIADAVATRRIALKTVLGEAYYDIETVTTLDALNTALQGTRPDVVMVDVALVQEDRFAACTRLLARLQPALIPLVLVGEAPVSTQIRAMQVGVDEFFSPPFREKVLVARLRNIVRRKHATDELLMRYGSAAELGLTDPLEEGALKDGPVEKGAQGNEPPPLSLVLAMGDGPSDQLLAAEIRRKLPDARLTCVHRPEQVLSTQERECADVTLITDGLGTSAAQMKAIAHMRAKDTTRHAAILSVVTTEEQGIVALGPEIGASDFVLRACAPMRLVPKIQGLARRARRSRALHDGLHTGLRLAVTDPLTQVSNRRYLMHHLPRQIREAQANGAAYAGMILDLDRFKSVNDTYGHAAGDAVLREAATRIRACLREGDLVARLGGEEFFVGLAHTDHANARRVAERIRTRMAAAPFRLPQGRLLTVTLSVGVAWLHADDEGAEPLLERADQALYRSKAQGRNRVTFTERAVA